MWFFFFNKVGRGEINVAIVSCNLRFYDSKSFLLFFCFLYIGKQPWAVDTISSQNKALRPVWTLVDTWGSNVAGHATDGSLIRHGDSHFFPIQNPPNPQPPTLDKPTNSQPTGGQPGVKGDWKAEGGEDGRGRGSVKRFLHHVGPGHRKNIIRVFWSN